MGFSFVESLLNKYGKDHRASFKIADNAITLSGNVPPTAQGIVNAILENGEPVKVRRPATAVSGLDGKGLSRSATIAPALFVHGAGEDTGLLRYLQQNGNQVSAENPAEVAKWERERNEREAAQQAQQAQQAEREKAASAAAQQTVESVPAEAQAETPTAKRKGAKA